MATYTGSAAYASLRSNLVNLPPSIATLLYSSNINVQDVVLDLSWSTGRVSKSAKRHAYVGWSGMTSRTDHTGAELVELDPVFAQALGINPQTPLSITVHSASSVPIARTIYLEPQSASDWEIIELHAQYLEARMLNQVRAVATHQPVVVFPSSTSIATLSVLKIEPPLPPGSDFAKVSADAEVVIAPKVRKKPQQSSSKSKSNRSIAASSNSRRHRSSGPCVLLRGVSLPHKSFPKDINNTSDYRIFVDQDSLTPLGSPEYVFVSIVRPKAIKNNAAAAAAAAAAASTNTSASAPPSSDDPNAVVSSEGTPADDDSGEVVYASHKIVARVVTSDAPPQDHVALSHALALALVAGSSVGNVVRIEAALKPLAHPPSTLIVRPYVTSSAPSKPSKSGPVKLGRSAAAAAAAAAAGKTPESQLAEKEAARQEQAAALRALLESAKILQGPITHNMRLPPASPALEHGGVLQLKSAEGWIKPGTTLEFAIELGTPLIQAESAVGSSLEAALAPEESSSQVVGIDKTLAEINNALRSGFSLGVLVHGARGSGKSAVLQTVERGLVTDLIHVVHVSCGPRAEDPVASIQDLLRRALLEASWHAPSVIVLDDFDTLVPAEVEHADGTKARQLAEVFARTARETMAARPVSILASVQAKESVHAHLTTAHVFEETVALKSPDKEVRRAVISEAMRQLGMVPDAGFDMLEVAGSTEGYQAGDLWTLVERTRHQTIIRRVETKAVDTATTQDDFMQALAGFVPASLRGVKLQKSGVAWAEIGGLAETKKMLLETLEWPTRYAPVFAKAPLRLRSGLLLYGYPGCGKTLLASAVASQSGLNFISVKGPEILNKYIGASEQSVRDLFERAQAARPCVLFFDEFDAIAPKRGHDSTGVTDRVVNQMLTQMDGAEGLDGVYVLAATSRPDLIDSALLRPGRLDKAMLCDMPSFEDRLDILQAVASGGGHADKQMALGESVDLAEVARQTQGYSGADLQAVLYNAYLDAIHDLVDLPEGDDDDADEGEDETDGDDVEYFQTRTEDHSARARIAEKARLKKQLEALAQPVAGKSSQASTTASTPNKVATIEARHLVRSLQDTQPSISASEQRKLAGIYRQFVSGRSGDMPTGESSTEVGARATLM
ncbi:uncharacterized protein SAPINGB_P000273 [Magnusiomyces paraingens]|uniref:Peroxisomal ATPase PEX1 n=1 Tax=Magnusiomyces paraingens TaxID=2606893 RepID=A0A5E8B346_9ASCO|nr:uncharacterized protein SAPINGB_P000273 [Saprochaete ingens]VVT44042.1 unnamed protein product [Saprochaete ingens]